jgi:polyisoprenoid-binding protein YceI
MCKIGPARKLLLPIAISFVVLAATSSAHAEDAVLEFDPSQTQIQMTLVGNFHSVHGTFKLKHGTVKIDPLTGHASGAIVVDAMSGDTGNGSRDHKMHTDVLESAQYSEISFAPERVQGQILPQGDFKVQVSGTFTLHGEKHPLSLDVSAHLSGDRLTADTSFNVPYEKWGLKNPSNFLLRVNDNVDIEIHAVGQLKLPGR